MTPVGTHPPPPVSETWVHPNIVQLVAWCFSDADHPFEERGE